MDRLHARSGRRAMIRGLVLAGGLSRRFGSDKARAFFGGRSFLDRAVMLLAAMRLEPIVVTRQGERYPSGLAPVIYDRLPGKGPLGGLYTAMREFPADGWLALTCDMPALEQNVLERLLVEYNERPVPSFYRAEDGVEPFPGIYPNTLFPEVSRRVFADSLAMKGLIDSIAEKNEVPYRGTLRALANVNRPEDLRELQT